MSVLQQQVRTSQHSSRMAAPGRVCNTSYLVMKCWAATEDRHRLRAITTSYTPPVAAASWCFLTDLIARASPRALASDRGATTLSAT